ncbi:MAG: O-antigen ligase family protein [Candidatus Latescibacterota bacterium]
MSRLLNLGRVAPTDPRLLSGAVLLQAALIAGPALWDVRYMGLLSGLLVAAGLALFSVRRTLVLALLASVVLPEKVLTLLILPGGLRLPEGLLVAAAGFALVDLVHARGLQVRPSGADLPVLAFLAVTVLSALVGVLHGNLTSVVLRDLRFPLYYGVFFLVTQFFDGRAVLRMLLPALIAGGLAVSGEYVLEFLGAIDLSMGSRFVRVARLEGVVLPVALLFVVNQFVHAPGKYGRPALGAAFLLLSLAFVLTVGRGMWVAFAIGLVASVVLWHLGRPREQRQTGRAVLAIAALLIGLAGAVLLFQRTTGAAVGAHALERSRTFVDLTRDVHVLGRLSSYLTTGEAVVRHPLLGSGQGATLWFLGFDQELNRFESTEAWTVDNLYLALAWKMGLVGLAVFLWLGGRITRLAIRLFRAAPDPESRAFAGGAVATLVGMAAFGLSDAAMVSGRLALVFGILFGMVAVAHRDLRGG